MFSVSTSRLVPAFPVTSTCQRVGATLHRHACGAFSPTWGCSNLLLQPGMQRVTALWPLHHLALHARTCVCVCVCLFIMHKNSLSPTSSSLHQSTVPQPTFSMPVTVPVSNQNAAAALQFSNNPGGALVTTTSFVTSTLTDPRLLSPQQPALQRNTVSPGLPQRPASAGEMMLMCVCGMLLSWQHNSQSLV